MTQTDYPYYNPSTNTFNIPITDEATIHNLTVDETLDISGCELTMTQYDNTSITFLNNKLQVSDNGINNNKLQDNSVTNSKILNLSISTNKLQDYSITNIKLALNSIATGNIQNNAITNILLDLLSVATGNIQDYAITTSKMAAQSVTNNILALLSVDTGHIINGAVTTSKIAALSITNALLALLSIATGNIQNGAVTTLKIANNAITNALLGLLSIATGNIQNGAITNTQLAASSVQDNNIVTMSASKLIGSFPDIVVNNIQIGINLYLGISNQMLIQYNTSGFGLISTPNRPTFINALNSFVAINNTSGIISPVNQTNASLYVFGSGTTNFPDVLKIRQNTNVNPCELSLGYNVTGDRSVIQSVHHNIGYTPLALNPNGGIVTTGNDLVATGNLKSLSGLLLPTPGGTPTLNNYYEEFNMFTNWGCVTSVTSGFNYQLRIVRNGSNVSMYIPPVTFTNVGTNAPTQGIFNSISNIPARFISSLNTSSVFNDVGKPRIANNTVRNIGIIQISSTGQIMVYADAALSNWSATGTVGILSGLWCNWTM